MGNLDLSQRTERTASNLQQASSSMSTLTGTVTHVLDVAQCRGHGRLHRFGDDHPGVFAHREQFGDHGRIAGDEAGAIAGQRRRLRQRVHGQQTGVVAVADRRMQHRHRFGVPGQAQVALVGGHQHPALARPADHLAQMIDAEHPAGGIAR